MEKDTTYVALDDSKRTIVAGILRPGHAQPELREIPNDPRLIRRLLHGGLRRPPSPPTLATAPAEPWRCSSHCC
jgi:hypothetical protein